MPDSRRHRGAHPEDALDFAAESWPTLQRATQELSFLLTRGYSEVASLKLVGDRYQLRERQRRAVLRAACSDEALVRRHSRVLELEALRDQTLGIDGLNCLITFEAILAGAPVFRGRDGALRDLASVHGTYRHVDETSPALSGLRMLLERYGVARAQVYLDRPVGNSGRLAAHITQVFEKSLCDLTTHRCDSVDPVLVTQERIVASSDSWVLDRAAHWVDLPAAFAHHAGVPLFCVPLGEARRS